MGIQWGKYVSPVGIQHGIPGTNREARPSAPCSCIHVWLQLYTRLRERFARRCQRSKEEPASANVFYNRNL